jgi:DNA-binding NarL/FixJ family response regulator
MKNSEKNPETVRLLVIEDNLSLVLAGLNTFFRPARDCIQVVLTAPGVDTAISSAHAEDFDVILLDLMIPGSAPEDNIARLSRHFPHRPVVIYTSLESEAWRKKMYDLGAYGYVHKNDPRDTLKQAVCSAFKGIRSIRVPAGEPAASPAPVAAPALTVTEREILRMMTEGMRYGPMAKILGLKPDAVETIVKRIRLRFGVRSTPQLIHLLTREGLL